MPEESSTSKYMSPEEAARAGPVRPISDPGWRTALSSLIVSFFLTANFIALSHYEPLCESWRPLARGISAFTGMDQNWFMFAPTPRKMSYHSYAVITFADGSERVYEFPRMELLSAGEKFRHYKLRRVFNDYMANPVGEKYRPYISRYLAESVWNDQNPPVRIAYIVNSADTPKPSSEHAALPQGGGLRANLSCYFVYDVEVDAPEH